jgi:membrane protein
MLFSIGHAFRRVDQLLRLVAARFMRDQCVQVAGNLTFTTLLALVPLFTIAFTLFAAFPVFEEWSNAFKAFLLTTLVPEVSGKVITVYMQQFADNAGKLTAVGLVFLAVTALMLMASIEQVFNLVWRAPRPRSLVQRLVIYWTIITIGPLLIGASLSLTSWLFAQPVIAGPSVSSVSSAQQALLKFLPGLLNAAAFALLYLMIPNRKVLVKDALVGGIIAAVGFELMKRGFGLYLQLFPTYDLIYGTFAIIPIFLLWLYLSWLLVLAGAVAVAVLPQWRLEARRGRADDAAALYRALRLIELLQRARSGARAPTVADLVTRSGIAEEDVEQLLEAMHAPGWVRRVEPAGWVLAADLSALTLRAVYRLFAVQAYAEERADGALLRAAGRLLCEVESALDVPLERLLARDGAEPWEPPSQPESHSAKETASP